jgi:hypothetical protein
MSDGTRPIAAGGYESAVRQNQECLATSLQILPSAPIRPIVKNEDEEAPQKARRRDDQCVMTNVNNNDRCSGAGKNREPQEIQLVVARSRGHHSGWSGRGGLPRLLAPPHELADRSAGMFLSSLPELWRQAIVRREPVPRVRPVPLRPQRPHCVGKVRETEIRSRGGRSALRVIARPPSSTPNAQPRTPND